MERLKCNLTFRELRKDENLYDDVDLTAGSMVDAQYRRVAGYEDNPDVCALPKMPSVRDILALGMVNPPGYDREKEKKMSAAEKLAAINLRASCPSLRRKSGSAASEISAPQPTIATVAFANRRWVSAPNSGTAICLACLRWSKAVSSVMSSPRRQWRRGRVRICCRCTG